MKVPSKICAWVHAFLSDRRAVCCRVGNSYSKSKKFSAGVPQGSVLGPVLFACYIDTLAKKLENVENLSNGFFADDLTLLSTNDNVKTDGMQIVQKYRAYTDTIGNWCNEYKMETAPEKCEAVMFSNWSGDTATIRRPQLTINNRQICYKEHVKLLGIVLDKGLAFNQHIKKVSVEAKRRINQLKTLSSTEWGCNTRVMRLLYVGYIRSVLEYGSDIWGNLISHSNLMKLEAIQNTGATLISGCVRTNNITSLLLEADLIPLSIRYEVNSIKRLERMHRMPNDNPLFDITSSSIPKQRLMRRNNKALKTTGNDGEAEFKVRRVIRKDYEHSAFRSSGLLGRLGKYKAVPGAV